MRRLCYIIIVAILLSAIVGCDNGDSYPSIDSFVLSYDIAGVGESIGAKWESSDGETGKIVVQHEGGFTAVTSDVPTNSDGVHWISTYGWEAGNYDVTLRITDSDGDHVERDLPILLVGPEGLWYKFSKRVYEPKGGDWLGIDDWFMITDGQGIWDEHQIISVDSKYMSFTKFKWTHGEPWPDSDCTDAHWAQISKLNVAFIAEEGVEYAWEWESIVGNYNIHVVWPVCISEMEGVPETSYSFWVKASWDY